MAAVPSSKCDNNKVRHAQPNCRLSIQDTVPAPPLSLPCTPLMTAPADGTDTLCLTTLASLWEIPLNSSMGRAPKDSRQKQKPPTPPGESVPNVGS